MGPVAALHFHLPRPAAFAAMRATATATATDTDRRRKQAELYHDQTKHSLTRYARGPHGLDWANQPNPFLRFSPTALLPLLHPDASSPSPAYSSIFAGPVAVAPHPLTFSTLSKLFYDSLSLSAWKTTGFSTWSLRVNPSSGNLHPTEAYVVSPALSRDGRYDLSDCSASFFEAPFVAHYAPKEHALELRAALPVEVCRRVLPYDGSFVVGLSSIFWREAWKYGERGFRYCNHDIGHAIAAVAIAAAGLGWDVRVLDGLGQKDLRGLFGIGMGFNKPERVVPSQPTQGKMPWVELEHPDCALLVFPAGERCLGQNAGVDYMQMSSEILRFKSLEWIGKPNSLSKDHICWDIIYRTAEAVEKPLTASERFVVSPFHSSGLLADGLYTNLSVREVVRRRRSAVDMDGVHVMGRQKFYQILLHCLPSGDISAGEKQGRQYTLPFRVLPWDSEVHAAMFVHRVKELPMGLYFLVRNEDHFDSLKGAMRSEFEWVKPDGCPAGLPFYRLAKGDCRELAKRLSCRQDIASDGCFSLGMVARFEPTLQEKNAWMYPRLFWETGVLGQVLYLEAHAIGISATGIGCYFDDAVHDVLGLKDSEFQSLYHFTVGRSVLDKRIMSLPAYPGPQIDA